MQINEDLDAITSILYQTFEITPFKRDYEAFFDSTDSYSFSD